MEEKNSVLERRNWKDGARPVRAVKPASGGKDEPNEEKLVALVRRKKLRKMLRCGLSA